MHDVICVNLYRTKKLIKSAKKRSNRSLPYLCIYSWICDVVFSSSNENMINGNCSFERILENFENIPEIRLSFVSICVLWISSVDADSANCLQCTPTFWHSQKGPKRVLKFLKGIAVCWSSPRFFKARFRFLLLWWSVGKPEDRADRLKKSHFLKALKLFYG